MEDTAVGIFLSAQGLPVNLGPGTEISIQELATLMATEVGFTGSLVWDTSKPNAQRRRCLDVQRAKQLFGFKAKHSLQEGLRNTI